MGKTAIAWTDETDNPVYIKRADGSHGGHWCRKHSPGCDHCYAEAVNQSGFFAFASHLPFNGQPPEGLQFDQSIVDAWARKRKPARRFVGSMTDLFGDWAAREWQFAMFDAAVAAPTQTIQFLTKRADIAYTAASEWCRERDRLYLPSNVLMGVTVESQRQADQRVETWRQMALLGNTWVSYEPALEAVNWDRWELIKWLVVGGESGSQARPFDLSWAIAAQEFCQGWRIAFFMKQLGDRPVMNVYDWYDWAETEGLDANDATLIDWSYQDGQPLPQAMCNVPKKGTGSKPDQWPPDLRVQQFPTLETA